VSEASGSNERVELSIPASVEWLALARTTGAAIASRWSFTYDEIADLRLAIDELCLTLVEGPNTDRLQLVYYLDDNNLHVEGHTVLAESGTTAASDDGATGDFALSADLSARILDALVDAHGLQDGSTEGTKTAWLRKKRSAVAE
jgi:hypothetical protein